MTFRRPVVLSVAFVLLAGFAAACGGSDPKVESAPRSTAPGAGTTAAGVDLNVYFLRGDKLGTAHRRVAPTPAVARAALEQLLAGPTDAEQGGGLASKIPVGTRLDGVDIAAGVATVTLSPPVTASQSVAQVVFTLTQFPSVQTVRLGSGGQPLGRDDVTDALPGILVESVAPGDAVASPLTVAGLNDTFESNVVVRVLGADRRVLATVPTTGSGGTGTWGPFSVSVPFNPGADTTGFVRVFDTSAKDGSVIDLVEVPIRFS